ncbi:hypothetical protein F7D01_05460 [Erythrobacter sp. 3-20A1M]|nr:hypothetical protein F7D01_05460 [Erythrobacter sp. 3-20A1M]
MSCRPASRTACRKRARFPVATEW